jgi:hypothetical protein
MAGRVWSVPLSVHPRSFASGLAAALGSALAAQIAHAVPVSENQVRIVIRTSDVYSLDANTLARLPRNRDFLSIINQDPTNPEHATNTSTGQDFYLDSANQWINSKTKQSSTELGLLVATAPAADSPIVVSDVSISGGKPSQTNLDLLFRIPNDPNRAADLMYGASFRWNANTNVWNNLQTGTNFSVVGYLGPAGEPANDTIQTIPVQVADDDCWRSEPTGVTVWVPRSLETRNHSLEIWGSKIYKRVPCPPPTSSPTGTLASSSTLSPPPSSSGTIGAGIQFQLRGFGGASFINGHSPATFGFDGAVLFPLGNHILVGPSAGFQWVNSSIVHMIGSQQPGSTFIHTSVGFKQGNFGGEIDFPIFAPAARVPFHPAELDFGIIGGITVADAKIKQQAGFCGLGNATSPAGCTVFSTTMTHDTVTGPYVGGYISHSIFPHVGVFVGYDYHFGLKATQPNPTNPSGPRTTVFDLHYSDVVAGFNLRF